jgi:hypothetical protein
MDFKTTNFDLSRSSSGSFCDGMRFGLVYTYCNVLYSTVHCPVSRTRYVREKLEDDLLRSKLVVSKSIHYCYYYYYYYTYTYT